MNTTDAEIAGIVRKLNGMKCGGAGITNQVLGFLSIYLLDRPMDHVTLGPKDLLAFCRAVVERVDGDKTELFRLLLEKCDRELTELGADPNEGLRKEVEDALGYT